MLVTRRRMSVLEDIRKAAALLIVAHARGSKEDLKEMMKALDRACDRYDKLKEDK